MRNCYTKGPLVFVQCDDMWATLFGCRPAGDRTQGAPVISGLTPRDDDLRFAELEKREVGSR